jgi:hypothetical protein
VLLKVFEHSGSEADFAGEGCYERVVGNHGLQIAHAILQPGSGRTGQHEEHARKDRVPAESGRTGAGRLASADGLGLVLEQAGVLDQFHYFCAVERGIV